MSNPVVGDIGTVFRTTIKDQDGTAVDVSSASTLQIIFKKPDGTILTKTAVFTTDGVNGNIEYPTISGDLDTAGSWTWQARVVIGSTEWKGLDTNGLENKFLVKKALA